jgi:hypothetical protein
MNLGTILIFIFLAVLLLLYTAFDNEQDDYVGWYGKSFSIKDIMETLRKIRLEMSLENKANYQEKSSEKPLPPVSDNVIPISRAKKYSKAS